MNENEIVRAVMQKKGYTQITLAEKAGMKYQSNVSEILRSKSMRVDNFIRLLNAMDCSLVVVSNNSADEWVVENSEK